MREGIIHLVCALSDATRRAPLAGRRFGVSFNRASVLKGGRA